MRDMLRRMAVGFSSGALAALVVLVLTSLLGRAGVGPAQAPLHPGLLLAQTGWCALWGLVMAVFMGQHWTRVLLAGTALGLGPGLHAWVYGAAWPRAAGAWAPVYIVGYCLLWGYFTGLLCAWLAEGGGGGKGKRR